MSTSDFEEDENSLEDAKVEFQINTNSLRDCDSLKAQEEESATHEPKAA